MSEHPYPEAGYHDNYSDNEGGPSHSGEPGGAKRKRLSDPTSPNARPTPRSHPASAPLSRDALEASWINAEPFDEFIREIGDFIAEVSRGYSNIEVTTYRPNNKFSGSSNSL